MEHITNFLENLSSWLKNYSPAITAGVFGAIIHRLRTKMTWIDFFKSIVISVFVALSVSIVCTDYFKIESQNLINVFCGIAGAFSKDILDEVGEIIGSLSDVVKGYLPSALKKNRYKKMDNEIDGEL